MSLNLLFQNYYSGCLFYSVISGKDLEKQIVALSFLYYIIGKVCFENSQCSGESPNPPT